MYSNNIKNRNSIAKRKEGVLLFIPNITGTMKILRKISHEIGVSNLKTFNFHP